MFIFCVFFSKMGKRNRRNFLDHQNKKSSSPAQGFCIYPRTITKPKVKLFLLVKNFKLPSAEAPQYIYWL